jgi:hypothetical protein
MVSKRVFGPTPIDRPMGNVAIRRDEGVYGSKLGPLHRDRAVRLPA